MDNIKLIELIKEKLENMESYKIPQMSMPFYKECDVKEVKAFIDGLEEVIKSINGK